jgi:hypothetical protein
MGQVLTPIYKWPYPDSADPVRDGATRMGNLAKAIDSTLNARMGPYLVQGGQTVATTNTAGAITVTFPFPFTGVPGVAITGCTTDAASVNPVAFIYTTQTTGTYFTCLLKNLIGNGWFNATPVRISWVAIGVAP